jgi:phage/plasmid primase-like uncharacterized protein
MPSIEVDGLKKVGKEYKGPCPLCGGTDRYYVRTDNTFGCRGCHEKIGDVIEYHKWRYGTSISELKKQYLYNPPKINHKPLNGKAHKKEKARAIPDNLTATYTYKDVAGNYLFQVLTVYENPTKSKEIG